MYPESLRSFLPLATVVLISASAGAQQPSTAQSGAPATTIKAETREVILPVTVRDKKGQVVPNLTIQDFTLQQDGHPETIKSFSHESNLPFRLGLLVDTSRSQSAALASEKSATGKFIDQMLSQPADKAFLLHFDREVELLQDFTASKTKLHHELDEMSSSNYSNDQAGSDNGGGRGNGDGGNGGNGGGRRRGGGTQMYDAIYLASNELMQKEPGRKALIVLSDGVDRGSKESLNDAIDAAEKANVSVYAVYFKGEEQNNGGNPMMRHGGMGGGGMGGRYPGGYPGGGGPRPGNNPTEAKVDGKKILEQIAARTGGVFFEAKKKDSFDEVYAQIGEELHGQYLLTYSPEKSTDDSDSDGFHKISLKAKDDKLTVITREGYYSQD